ELPKLPFVLADPLFGPLSVLDIDTRPIPFHDVSQLVAQRHVADQPPAILPVRPSQPCFTLHRLTLREGCAPLVHEPREVIGMNCGAPVPAQSVLHRSTRRFHPAFTDEINGAVRQSAPYVRRNCVDDKPEPVLAGP